MEEGAVLSDSSVNVEEITFICINSSSDNANKSSCANAVAATPQQDIVVATIMRRKYILNSGGKISSPSFEYSVLQKTGYAFKKQ